MRALKPIRLYLIMAFSLCVNLLQAQSDELTFSNYSLDSGVAGQDGAKYRFPNVAAGVDAIVTIVSRSHAAVILESMDTTGVGMGYGKAFQPVLGYPGTAPANTNWSMTFRMTFVKTTTDDKINVSHFFVTGLDIDGDSQALSEWAEVKYVSSVDTSLVNNLIITKTATSPFGDNYKVEGITTTAPGIDTAALNVMASYEFTNKDEIEFTLGANNGNRNTTAGVRLNSLWFRDFFNPILPVSLTYFTANLKENKKVQLTWSTHTEENASHFVVERSTDGKSFSEVGLVLAHGTSWITQEYSFSDDLSKSENTTFYYRLRAVDFDGRTEFSRTRLISLKSNLTNTLTIKSYPNPVRSSLHITLPAQWQQKKVQVDLYAMNGKWIKRVETPAAGQTEDLSMDELTSGYYIVRAQCGAETAQEKVMKH